MTEPEAIEVMTQRWLDAWPTLQPTVPFGFRGETFDSAPTWARVSIAGLDRVQGTLGHPARYDSRGLVTVQLFADIDRGAAPLAGLVQSVIEVFESQDLGDGLVTYSARPAGGPADDGRWLIQTITIPYWFEDQR